MAQLQHIRARKSTERPHILTRQAAASMRCAADLLLLAAGRTFSGHSRHLLRLAELAGGASAHLRRMSRKMGPGVTEWAIHSAKSNGF
jgi:hypothetical protein